MNLRAIRAILQKDLVAFSRDRFYVFITILGLVAFVVMYWLLPDSVDETVRLGVHQTDLGRVFTQLEQTEGDGLEITQFDSVQALTAAVEDGTDGIVAGIAFPPDFAAAAGAGSPIVDLLVPANVAPDHVELVKGLATQVAYAVTGSGPAIDLATRTVILGVDRTGDQVSMQEQMRPLLAFFVLLVETFALSSLVAIEVQQRTVTAVLVTPTRARDFIAAKGVLGAMLALVEVLLLMTLIRGFVGDVPVLLVALVLGAFLVTGIGLLAGASGRDFMGVLFLTMLLMIPLMIPAFAALFPGTAATWIKVLPTFGLVEAIVGVTTRAESWVDLAGALFALAGWGVALFSAGAVVLRRRVTTL